jgi:hypothetical protein
VLPACEIDRVVARASGVPDSNNALPLIYPRGFGCRVRSTRGSKSTFSFGKSIIVSEFVIVITHPSMLATAFSNLALAALHLNPIMPRPRTSAPTSDGSDMLVGVRCR